MQLGMGKYSAEIIGGQIWSKSGDGEYFIGKIIVIWVRISIGRVAKVSASEIPIYSKSMDSELAG